MRTASERLALVEVGSAASESLLPYAAPSLILERRDVRTVLTDLHYLSSAGNENRHSGDTVMFPTYSGAPLCAQS